MLTDHVNDTNQSLLYQVGKTYVFPEMMSNFSPMSEKEASAADLRLFADPVNRRFPIGSAADTWLSATYFEKQAAALDADERNEISQRLLTAIDVWGLQGTFLRKEAAPAPKPLTIIRCGDADVSINVPADLQKLAQDLVDHTEKYPFETRKMTAWQIMEAEHAAATDPVGARLTAHVRGELQKMACDMSAPKTDVLNTIETREELYRHLYHAEYMDKTAALKETVTAGPGVVTSEVLQKVAGALDDLDRLAGLHRSGYSQSFRTPENMFGGMTHKQAAKARSYMCRMPNGRIVMMHKTAGIEETLTNFLKESLAVPGVTGNLYRDLSSLTTADSDALCAAYPALLEM